MDKRLLPLVAGLVSLALVHATLAHSTHHFQRRADVPAEEELACAPVEHVEDDMGARLRYFFYELDLNRDLVVTVGDEVDSYLSHHFPNAQYSFSDPRASYTLDDFIQGKAFDVITQYYTAWFTEHDLDLHAGTITGPDGSEIPMFPDGVIDLRDLLIYYREKLGRHLALDYAEVLLSHLGDGNAITPDSLVGYGMSMAGAPQDSRPSDEDLATCRDFNSCRDCTGYVPEVEGGSLCAWTSVGCLPESERAFSFSDLLESECAWCAGPDHNCLDACVARGFDMKTITSPGTSVEWAVEDWLADSKVYRARTHSHRRLSEGGDVDDAEDYYDDVDDFDDFDDFDDMDDEEEWGAYDIDPTHHSKRTKVFRFGQLPRLYLPFQVDFEMKDRLSFEKSTRKTLDIVNHAHSEADSTSMDDLSGLFDTADSRVLHHGDIDDFEDVDDTDDFDDEDAEIPECPFPSLAGDGWCDPINNFGTFVDPALELVFPDCYDGGDCCQTTCASSAFPCDLNPSFACTDPNALAAEVASSPTVGDGMCDHDAEDDGGDCCWNTCEHGRFLCGTNGYQCDDPSMAGTEYFGWSSQSFLMDLESFPAVNTDGWEPYKCPNPFVVGDGVCDEENNVPRCYDGGDCCLSSCQGDGCGTLSSIACRDPFTVEGAKLATLDEISLNACPKPMWVNDGVCDEENNVSPCWDGTDCCEETCVYAECSDNPEDYRCMNPHISPPHDRFLCYDTCEHANDGICQDGGTPPPGQRPTEPLCAFGTDCSDCGARPEELDPDDLGWAMAGQNVFEQFYYARSRFGGSEVDPGHPIEGSHAILSLDSVFVYRAGTSPPDDAGDNVNIADLQDYDREPFIDVLDWSGVGQSRNLHNAEVTLEVEGDESDGGVRYETDRVTIAREGISLVCHLEDSEDGIVSHTGHDSNSVSCDLSVDKVKFGNGDGFAAKFILLTNSTCVDDDVGLFEDELQLIGTNKVAACANYLELTSVMGEGDIAWSPKFITEIVNGTDVVQIPVDHYGSSVSNPTEFSVVGHSSTPYLDQNTKLARFARRQRLNAKAVYVSYVPKSRLAQELDVSLSFRFGFDQGKAEKLIHYLREAEEIVPEEQATPSSMALPSIVAVVVSVVVSMLF